MACLVFLRRVSSRGAAYLAVPVKIYRLVDGEGWGSVPSSGAVSSLPSPAGGTWGIAYSFDVPGAGGRVQVWGAAADGCAAIAGPL